MVNDKEILVKILNEIDSMSDEEVEELERKAVAFIEKLEDIYRDEYVLDMDSEIGLNVSNSTRLFKISENSLYRTTVEDISFVGEVMECQAA